MNDGPDETILGVPEEAAQEPVVEAPCRPRWSTARILLGLAFVLLGAVFLVDEAWPGLLAWRYVWPVALVALGLAIILRARR